MYYSSVFSSIVLPILFCFLICYIAAWWFAMKIITKAAIDKGYNDICGNLWFIGIFATPIFPAVIVAALSDKRLPQNSSTEQKAIDIDSELPGL